LFSSTPAATAVPVATAMGGPPVVAPSPAWGSGRAKPSGESGSASSGGGCRGDEAQAREAVTGGFQTRARRSY
jgi:hypothetical protein